MLLPLQWQPGIASEMGWEWCVERDRHDRAASWHRQWFRRLCHWPWGRLLVVVPIGHDCCSSSDICSVGNLDCRVPDRAFFRRHSERTYATAEGVL